MAWWGIAIDYVFVYSALAFCDAYSELSRDSGNSKLNEENGQKFKVTHGRDRKSWYLSAWIANRFEHHVDSADTPSVYPNWLTDLSVDGLCSIVQAFGVRSAPHQTVLSNAQRKGNSTGHWRAVAERALSRLEQLESRKLDSSGLNDLVWEGGLEGVALRCAQQEDRQVAQILMQMAFGKTASARFGSHGAPLSQLSLF